MICSRADERDSYRLTALKGSISGMAKRVKQNHFERPRTTVPQTRSLACAFAVHACQDAARLT
jgi:hypothetical protein